MGDFNTVIIVWSMKEEREVWLELWREEIKFFVGQELIGNAENWNRSCCGEAENCIVSRSCVVDGGLGLRSIICCVYF